VFVQFAFPFLGNDTAFVLGWLPTAKIRGGGVAEGNSEERKRWKWVENEGKIKQIMKKERKEDGRKGGYRKAGENKRRKVR
jgi:hypothetical protein